MNTDFFINMFIDRLKTIDRDKRSYSLLRLVAYRRDVAETMCHKFVGRLSINRGEFDEEDWIWLHLAEYLTLQADELLFLLEIEAKHSRL